VARCATPADVAEALALARDSGLVVAVRSGGHCFAGRSSTEGVVIDVAPMGAVSVVDGVATVGAGARLGHLYDALLAHGVTIPAGCGPDVGIAGLTLGGGLGILGRKHGLTCDSLVGAQVVLADGGAVDCDEQCHEDLFWALRGGGAAGLGVVTSLAFRTLPPPPATAFHLRWQFTEAAAVVEAWQGWAPTAPAELAASLLITAAADPREAPVANVFGAMLAGEQATLDLLERLVAGVGSDPSATSSRHVPFREAKHRLVQLGLGDERPGALPYSKSEYFRERLPPDAIASLLDRFVDGRVAGESRELDFTPWGGAYNDLSADATAFPHRSELFLLKQAAVLGGGASSEQREHARRWLAESWDAVHPWGAGGVYPNFPDPELEDEAAAYYTTNRERLAGVKARYESRGLFGS
jgi:FAD/FMN-containing dehydrogenase